MNYCDDVDLLYWEPSLFRHPMPLPQRLISGSGTVTGNQFFLDDHPIGFVNAHIAPRMAILITGTVYGTFPIVRVDNATTLTISSLYDGLYPVEAEAQAGVPGNGEGQVFDIFTFLPQASVVSRWLEQMAALQEGQTIVNASALRRPCVLGTLQMIYNDRAAASEKPENFLVRADLYDRLFWRAVRQLKIEIDTDGDGKGDLARMMNVGRMERE